MSTLPASDTENTIQSCDIINPLCLSTITKRKSAFLPYKPNAVSTNKTTNTVAIETNPSPHSCVLTNLQRGNTEAHIEICNITLGFHERCGQGEVTEAEVELELNLLNKGLPNTVDVKNKFTALHWASYYGQNYTVQLLCKHGANVNHLAQDHVAPLHLAAAAGHNEVVKCLLLNGACASQTDIMGNTALMYAAAGNHPHTTNELLVIRANNLMATNDEGDSAYSLAVKYKCGSTQCVLENYMLSMLTPKQK